MESTHIRWSDDGTQMTTVRHWYAPGRLHTSDTPDRMFRWDRRGDLIYGWVRRKGDDGIEWIRGQGSHEPMCNRNCPCRYSVCY